MTVYAGLYSDIFLDTNSALLRDTAYTVYESDGTTLSTLYADRTAAVTVSNPGRSTDSAGWGAFYATPGIHKITCNGATSTVEVPIDGAGLTAVIGKQEQDGYFNHPVLFDPDVSTWDATTPSVIFFGPSSGQAGCSSFAFLTENIVVGFDVGTRTSDGRWVAAAATFVQSDTAANQWAEVYHTAEILPWSGSDDTAMRAVLGIDGDWGAGYATKLFCEVRPTYSSFVFFGQPAQTDNLFTLANSDSHSLFYANALGYVQIGGDGHAEDWGELTIYGAVGFSGTGANIDLGVSSATGVVAGFWSHTGGQVFGVTTAGSSGGADAIGFFDTAPVTKRTGVAVSAAGIHAALVSYGLISA